MDVAQETFSKKPGDWFGPSATAHILQKTIEQNRDTDMLNNKMLHFFHSIIFNQTHFLHLLQNET